MRPNSSRADEEIGAGRAGVHAPIPGAGGCVLAKTHEVDLALLFAPTAATLAQPAALPGRDGKTSARTGSD